MIEAGKYICPFCGRIMSRAFYKGRDMAIGALLTRNHGKPALVPCVAGSHDISDADSVEFFLENPEQAKSGLPDLINVSYKIKGEENGDTHRIEMRRCCPECTDVRYFSPWYGRLPTYVIAVVGGRYAGKTVWLGSIAYGQNCARLNSGDFPCQIEPDALINVSQLTGQTSAREKGNTNVFYLGKKPTRNDPPEYYACVLLRDFGGELFRPEHERAEVIEQDDETPLLDLLNIPDAYLFVADESSPGNEERLSGTHYANEAYNTLRRRIMSREHRPLMGMILSHADVWMESRPSKEISDEFIPQVPLLTKDTFDTDNSKSYKASSFLARIELEDMIAREISPLAQNSRIAGWVQKSFLVKSIDPMLSGDGRSNYQNGINVYDPLIWILNRLGIFPLE